MALAPSSLAFTGRASKFAGINSATGNKVWNFYTGLSWVENETSPCFYRVEMFNNNNSRNSPQNAWVFVQDIPKGVRAAFIGRVGVKELGNSAIQLVNTVRVTCITIPDDLSPGVTTLAVPTPHESSHVTANNFAPKTLGHVGDSTGFVDVSWDDASDWVEGGTISFVKASSNQQLATNPILIGGAIATFGDGFGFGVDGHGRAKMSVKLGTDSKSITDGDLVTILLDSLITEQGPIALRTADSFIFYREITLVQFTATATRTVPFSKQVQVVSDATTPANPATFSATGLPTGLSISSSGLISGTPTVEGTFAVTISATNLAGIAATPVTSTIVVNPPTNPVINSPATSQTLQTLVPASLQLRATNNPQSFSIVSGSLPTGLTLNTTTGLISGTPIVVASATNVVFKATNNVGDSPNYTISFTVIALQPPVVTSPSAATAYVGQAFSYQIATNVPASDYNVSGLPPGLSRSGSTIVGTLPTNSTLQVYSVSIQAINQAGTGAEFILSLTVAVQAPSISSALAVSGFLGSPFRYQIAATNSPTSYAAVGLPSGLSLSPITGLVTGTPTVVGVFSVSISATNAGGTTSKNLVITLTVPPIPVIDVGITSGKTVTALTNVPFIFQPSASYSPTVWTADPIPDGMALDTTNGKLSGAFSIVGLYAVTFVATNAGGDSLPVTFYFLVNTGPPTAIQANSTGIDIWVNLHNAGVSISDPVGANSTVVVKRGDTSELNIRFHKDGVPIDIIPSTLKFAARIDLDQDYVVFIDTFSKIGTGAFKMLPDFSDNNTELESDLNQDQLDLVAEIQWETADPFTRRSSTSFKLTVLRDVIHPD